jgi:prolyl-tRNA editing enzyme YbaK/EbsC (Cys-tRNA(Pro) deacylase)
LQPGYRIRRSAYSNVISILERAGVTYRTDNRIIETYDDLLKSGIPPERFMTSIVLSDDNNREATVLLPAKGDLTLSLKYLDAFDKPSIIMDRSLIGYASVYFVSGEPERLIELDPSDIIKNCNEPIVIDNLVEL